MSARVINPSRGRVAVRMHSDTKTDQGEPLACPKRIDRSALGRALNSRRSREYNAKDKNSGAESHHAVRGHSYDAFY